MKSIDKFKKIIYNKVKGKIITTVMLPLYVFVFKTTARAWAVEFFLDNYNLLCYNICRKGNDNIVVSAELSFI